MNVARTRWRVWRTAAVAAAIASLVTVPGVARAGDDERTGKPWLPMVEEDASVDEVYGKYALSVVHVGDEGWRVNRGQYRESVSRKDFFVTVGRPDLAAREQSRRGLQIGLLSTSVGLVITGGVVMFAGISKGGWDPPPSYGFGMAAVGVGLMWIGGRIHGPEVPVDEVDAVVNRYNELLKTHIEEETGTSKPKPIQARLQLITPFVDGRSGGGLMAVASF